MFPARLKPSFMLQGSWGQLMSRSSTTWRWAANFWLLVSWLKPCPTTTLLWVRLHTDMQTHKQTHIYAVTTGWHFQSPLMPVLFRTYTEAHLPTSPPNHAFKYRPENWCFWHFTEGDSKNYLTYYKRAAVFLAMGKSKSALPDLTRAIQLKPDFLAVSSPCSLKKIDSLFCIHPHHVSLCVLVSSLLFFPSLYAPALSGKVAEGQHPVKAGQHTGGQGGLWSSGKFKP